MPVMMPSPPTPVVVPSVPPLPLFRDERAELAAQAKVTTGSNAKNRRFMGGESKIPARVGATSGRAGDDFAPKALNYAEFSNSGEGSRQ
jgi:hypothetical protein